MRTRIVCEHLTTRAKQAGAVGTRKSPTVCGWNRASQIPTIEAIARRSTNANQAQTTTRRSEWLKTDLACRASKSRTWLRNMAFRFVITVALVVALGIPAFSESPNTRDIPFENSRIFELVLVRVEVNGRPAVLIVDTASNRTIISSELADMGPRTANNVVSTKKGSGLTGTGAFARVTLKLAHITWRDHQIVVMDMKDFSKSFGQKIDGMLGMDFFSEFELVVVDLKNRKLILKP